MHISDDSINYEKMVSPRVSYFMSKHINAIDANFLNHGSYAESRLMMINNIGYFNSIDQGL